MDNKELAIGNRQQATVAKRNSAKPMVGRGLRWVMLCAFSIFHSPFSTVQAQYVVEGTDPASLRWSHIRNKQFDVIFPDSIRTQGEHFMRLLNRSYLPVSAGMKHQPHRIPVILHPYNLQSNGMVVWTPSRMEIYTPAPSDGYGQPWLEQLALHEFRHVVQTDMMNRGFTRGLYYLLGDQAVALPSAFIRPWLFEGDAVSTETAMSFTGRGRMPSFSMGLRTLALSGKKYSYDKYLFGSYKDYIPNHYEYGYQMVAYGRLRYGADLWQKVFRFTGSYPFLIFPQSIATKKYTGKNSKHFHHEAKQFLDSMWQAQQLVRTDSLQPLVREFSFDRYTDFSSLNILADSSVFAMRTTLSRTPMLVSVEPDATTKKAAMLGNVSSKLISVRSSMLWTEYRPDARWEQKSYSELWRYNAKRKRKQRLTHRTSYFTPAVNEGLQLAVSEKHPSGEQSVLLLDSLFQPSEELMRFPLGESVHDLVWIDSENLAVLYAAAQGMSIGVLNIRTRQLEMLLPFTYAEVADLSAHEGRVFFSSGYDGVNNIYAVEVQGKSVYKLTNSAYGAFSPRPNFFGNKLYYIDYTVQGGMPVVVSVDSLRWEKTAFDSPRKFPLAEAVAQQEQLVLDTVPPDTAPLEVRRYSKLLHLFRLHSWAPLHFSPSEMMGGDVSSAAVGATLLSQNNLSSMVGAFGYKYDRGFSSVNASLTYTGWYPVIQLSGNYGTRYSNHYDLERGTAWRKNDELYGELNLTTYLPFNFTRGNIQQSFMPYLQLQWSNDWQVRDDVEGMTEARMYSANLGFSAQAATRMAKRDINPRWGAALNVNVQSVFNTWKKASVSGQAYLPGLPDLPNHSIRLYAGYERQQLPLAYDTRLAKPRGLAFDGGFASPKLHSLSASYAFPLWCPDISLGALAYIKRIRVNLFADYMVAFYDKANTSRLGVTTLERVRWAEFNSAGYEVVFDFHAFRFLVLISAGWRQSFTSSYVQGGAPPVVLPVEGLLSFSL